MKSPSHYVITILFFVDLTLILPTTHKYLPVSLSFVLTIRMKTSHDEDQRVELRQWLTPIKSHTNLQYFSILQFLFLNALPGQPKPVAVDVLLKTSPSYYIPSFMRNHHILSLIEYSNPRVSRGETTYFIF